MTPENRDFHEFLHFLDICQEASTRLLKGFWMLIDSPKAFPNDYTYFIVSKIMSDHFEKIKISDAIACTGALEKREIVS